MLFYICTMYRNVRPQNCNSLGPGLTNYIMDLVFALALEGSRLGLGLRGFIS